MFRIRSMQAVSSGLRRFVHNSMLCYVMLRWGGMWNVASFSLQVSVTHLKMPHHASSMNEL